MYGLPMVVKGQGMMLNPRLGVLIVFNFSMTKKGGGS